MLGQMLWGFPRLTREMRLRGDPPGRIGLVADLTNPMWETLVVESRYRCLIPLTHFANPNGTPGEKTRSWFSLEGQPIVAWAGFCKNTAEFGRSEEHTSELQSLMRISYAVFCLKKKKCTKDNKHVRLEQ